MTRTTRLWALGVGVAGLSWMSVEMSRNSERESGIVSCLSRQPPWLSSRVNAKTIFPSHDNDKLAFSAAIEEARKHARLIHIQSGSPGLSVAVSVDGRLVWSEGFGYADVENRVRCKPETVMRVASISKAMTAGLLATMMEDGIVDLDAEIQKYVPEFPVKTWRGEEAKITTRMLTSHLAGIRHYDKNVKDVDKEKEKANEGNEGTNEGNEKTNEEKADNEKENEKSNEENEKVVKEEGVIKDAKHKCGKENADLTPSAGPQCTSQSCNPNNSVLNRTSAPKVSEFEEKEYFIKDHFDSVFSSLSLFKDDPLVAEPGTKFHYTTHGWTLVSAVIEAAAAKEAAAKRSSKTEESEKAGAEKKRPSRSSPTFVHLMTSFFKRLQMGDTRCEENDPLILDRARHYRRHAKTHRLENVTYVDNSYKWAGGGFLSTVEDLIKFGNAHLYAFQYRGEAEKFPARCTASCDDESEKGFLTRCRYPRGFVSRAVMKTLWKPAPNSVCPWAKDEPGSGYGIGWAVVPSVPLVGGPSDPSRGRLWTPTYVSHTGGAVGASSVLLIVPRDCVVRDDEAGVDTNNIAVNPHEGVVVAMIANLQEVGLYKTAVKIADLFVDS